MNSLFQFIQLFSIDILRFEMSCSDIVAVVDFDLAASWFQSIGPPTLAMYITKAALQNYTDVQLVSPITAVPTRFHQLCSIVLHTVMDNITGAGDTDASYVQVQSKA